MRSFQGTSFIWTKTYKDILKSALVHLKEHNSSQNQAFKHYQANKANKQLFEIFQSLQNQLYVSIEHARQNYYSRILSNVHDPLASPETYWSVLKSFLNNDKIPSTPYVQHSHVT